MHEYGMCESIVESVERWASGRRVTAVRVRAGALHRVVDSALEQAFALAADGTVADGAAVEVVTVPVRFTCLTCGHAGTSNDPLRLCPACGAAAVELTGGDELVVESIDYAAPASRSP